VIRGGGKVFNFKQQDHGNAVYIQLEEDGKPLCELPEIKVMLNEMGQWTFFKKTYVTIPELSANTKEDAIKLAMRELLTPGG
jgi:hypothetical protein